MPESRNVTDAEVLPPKPDEAPSDTARPPEELPPVARGTLRQLKMGRELVAGARSLKEAALAAGYAEHTANSPRRNGLLPSRLLPAVEREEGVSLATLEKKALRTLDTVLSRDDPGQTEATTAGGVLRMRREFSDEEQSDSGPTHDGAQSTRLCLLTAARLGARLGSRFGERAAAAILARLQAHGLDELPPADEWRYAQPSELCQEIAEAAASRSLSKIVREATHRDPGPGRHGTQFRHLNRSGT